ncbi:terpene cyclase [Streptacidiphilus sp. EB129]|uniref:terpene synthase family protein n=1 Tax=Streptacidiphilus sp. EB129 TaxID=3156262 RepID=UPI00351880AF
MELTIPFPQRINPHRDAAAGHNLSWLQAHDMLRGSEAIDRYTSWNLADLAAWSFPDASPEELVLAMDQHAFYFLFDDQFDSELGLHPVEVADVCAPLIEIAASDPERTTPRRHGTPIISAFADLWRRGCAGMSPRWRARASYHWEWYFAAHPNEALGRALAAEARRDGTDGEIPGLDAYLMLRRGASGVETVLDLMERMLGEVPAVAFHSPELRQMRQLAADAPATSNDVWSYGKEAARGDVYNLVVVLQHQQQCTLAEAVSAVLAQAQWMIDEFVRLSERVPELCERLGLRGAERRAVERYRDGMGSWMRGYFDWEHRTVRYRPEGTLPPDRPNYLETLLRRRW